MKMEKNLNDYLHLYFDCEVLLINDITEDYGDESYEAPAINSIGKLTLINHGNFKIDFVDESEAWHYGVTFEDCYIALWDMNDFKLILRPLSDITEEEVNDLHDNVIREGHENYSITHKKNYVWLNIGDGKYEPKIFIYLLSKHFDLFGLIDAGLAIDKTKLIKTA